jgi:hypothetical protein
MGKRAHLRVVGADGEVFESSSPEETIRALEAALTRAQKTIDGLKMQLEDRRAKARKTHPIDEAYEDWKRKLVAAGMKGKGQCKLSPDRIERMAAMFDAGYTLEHFLLVNTGIAAFPFVKYGKRQEHGPEGDREICIGYVCKEAKRFEEAARLGAIVEKGRAQ